MKAADQSILQLLAPPKKLELTPSNVARNAGLSRGYTSERLSTLEEHGLVEADREKGHPYYSISKRGQAFLDGELTVEELEKTGLTD